MLVEDCVVFGLGLLGGESTTVKPLKRLPIVLSVDLVVLVLVLVLTVATPAASSGAKDDGLLLLSSISISISIPQSLI